MARRRHGLELREAALPELGQVSLGGLGGALEAPFDIAATQFNARAELVEYPPLALVDPGVIARVPGEIGHVPAVVPGVTVA